MSFKGMNPDQGREVAAAIKTAGENLQSAIDDVYSIVSSVEWVGPDYDAYVADFSAFVGDDVANLRQAYYDRGNDLENQADEQDDTSNQN